MASILMQRWPRSWPRKAPCIRLFLRLETVATHTHPFLFSGLMDDLRKFVKEDLPHQNGIVLGREWQSAEWM